MPRPWCYSSAWASSCMALLAPRSRPAVLLAAAGGVIAGLLVGAAIFVLRPRIADPRVEGVVALLTPFAAYLPADLLGASGVLGGGGGPLRGALLTARRRPSAPAGRRIWELGTFVVNGLDVHSDRSAAAPYRAGAVRTFASRSDRGGVLVSAAVIVLRIAWVYPGEALATRRTRRPGQDCRPSPRRGGYPGVGRPARRDRPGDRARASRDRHASRAFPDRDLMLFLTFGVILVTLVGQGLTLSPLIRRLGVSRGRHGGARRAAGTAGRSPGGTGAAQVWAARDDAPPNSSRTCACTTSAAWRGSTGAERRRAAKRVACGRGPENTLRPPLRRAHHADRLAQPQRDRRRSVAPRAAGSRPGRSATERRGPLGVQAAAIPRSAAPRRQLPAFRKLCSLGPTAILPRLPERGRWMWLPAAAATDCCWACRPDMVRSGSSRRNSARMNAIATMAAAMMNTRSMDCEKPTKKGSARRWSACLRNDVSFRVEVPTLPLPWMSARIGLFAGLAVHCWIAEGSAKRRRPGGALEGVSNVTAHGAEEDRQEHRGAQRTTHLPEERRGRGGDADVAAAAWRSAWPG